MHERRHRAAATVRREGDALGPRGQWRHRHERLERAGASSRRGAAWMRTSMAAARGSRSKAPTAGSRYALAEAPTNSQRCKRSTDLLASNDPPGIRRAGKYQ